MFPQGQCGHSLKLTIFILNKECMLLDTCGWELPEVCQSGTARKVTFYHMFKPFCSEILKHLFLK